MARSTADNSPPLHRLPAYLQAENPPETLPELAMQVLLLTHEAAMVRQRLTLMANALSALAAVLRLPSGDPSGWSE